MSTLLIGRLFPKQAVWAATAVALLVLGLALADVAQRFRALRSDKSGLVAPAPDKERGEQPPADYQMRKIISAHLFGKQPIQDEKAISVKAPETKLRLTLKGVVAGSSPEHSRAIIAVESGRANSYAIGQMIERSDARLHAIKESYVLLDRSGRLETLSINRESLNESIRKGVRPSDPTTTTPERTDRKIKRPDDLFKAFEDGFPSG